MFESLLEEVADSMIISEPSHVSELEKKILKKVRVVVDLVNSMEKEIKELREVNEHLELIMEKRLEAARKAKNAKMRLKRSSAGRSKTYLKQITMETKQGYTNGVDPCSTFEFVVPLEVYF
jgi:uncharacterized protein Yka (UPF0111/DUF47 family)